MLSCSSLQVPLSPNKEKYIIDCDYMLDVNLKILCFILDEIKLIIFDILGGKEYAIGKHSVKLFKCIIN